MTVRVDPLHALETLVGAYGENIPLDRGMIAIAQVERPRLDSATVFDELDRLAGRVRVHGVDRETGGRNAIAAVLFDEAGFRPHRENDYAPENSLIDQVLNHRRGMPITLAIIWMEVARRVDVPVEGVGFPGHFLVRHRVQKVWHYIDVFGGARVLDTADLLAILARTQGPKVDLQASMLNPTRPKQILIRVLRNLKNAYGLAKDDASQISAIDRLLRLDPNLQGELRDRGLVYARLGLVKAALRDLHLYLESPDVSPRERRTLERMLLELEARGGRLN